MGVWKFLGVGSCMYEQKRTTMIAESWNEQSILSDKVDTDLPERNMPQGCRSPLTGNLELNCLT